MANTEQGIRDAVVAYLRKTGRCPNWKSIGTTWDEGRPVYDRMIEDGTLVWDVQISPKGRRMSVLRLGEGR